MLFSYGAGEYIKGSKKIQGEIILGDHKLYLRNKDGDLASTYMPIEKIERIKSSFFGITVFVRPSIVERYSVIIKGQRKLLVDLVKDLVHRRGLKKKGIFKEWFDDSPL